MTHRRTRAFGRAPAALIATAGLAGAMLLPLAPAAADPGVDDIAQVRERAERLYHQAEQASERVNAARIDLREHRRHLHQVRSDLQRERQRVHHLHTMVVSSVVDQAQGQSLSTTVQVMTAPDTDEFLGQMAAVSSFQDQQAGLMAKFAAAQARIADRKSEIADQVENLAEVRTDLAHDKIKIQQRADEAQALLGDLVSKRREQRREAAAQAATSTPVAPTAGVAASGNAATAVSFALSQVGDAYVYGAAGPDAWDCSGLMMGAWGAAGVALPHSSSAQMSSGTPVSSSALQPGDLVFYYSPVSHVGMYIGNGQVVHAANPSTGVEVSDVFSMPFSGAVRPS